LSTPILEIKELSKSYKKGEKVLDSLNLTIPKGKIIGLLGPNGCGKTTLLKMISGLLIPDSGTISIDGIPRSEETNALISYLPERPYFSPQMRVDELIEFFSVFYEDFDVNTANKMLATLNINLKSKLKTLSKGTKEKIQLVLVMSRKAKLYLLDEPIGGVDPAARDYILSTIIGNYNPEASVIITTHLINDIEPALDEFIFMSYGGKVVLQGNADAVREREGRSLDQIFREVFKCSINV
jgi:ABC-2 type transport system ATP-binding protein